MLAEDRMLSRNWSRQVRENGAFLSPHDLERPRTGADLYPQRVPVQLPLKSHRSPPFWFAPIHPAQHIDNPNLEVLLQPVCTFQATSPVPRLQVRMYNHQRDEAL